MTNTLAARMFAKGLEREKILMWTLMFGAVLLMVLGVYGLYTHRIIGFFFLAADVWFGIRLFRLHKKRQG